jgi:hypothetical protein
MRVRTGCYPTAGMQRTFKYRGIVEGFFGPPWSLEQRCAMFEFGAQRAMNCYLYAPKDDPFHRERWREPYPEAAWDGMRRLVAAAQANAVEFVYGFHPGHGLRFGEDEAIDVLLAKARRFHEAGVRRFAVLFDDIPSRLAHAEDERRYGASLARAEGAWLARILERQPRVWAERSNGGSARPTTQRMPRSRAASASSSRSSWRSSAKRCRRRSRACGPGRRSYQSASRSST